MGVGGHSRAGEIVSHYRIEKKLGSGGMGEVYQAVDVDLGRPVVLKFLLPHLWDDESIRERFIREAKAASSLDHPNICTIYEIGRSKEDDPFIAMAYYEGETLARRIDRDGPLPLDEIIEIGRQLAGGLARAHQGGVVHRDVKPDNVILTNDGFAKILDFGVAKLREAPNLTSTNTPIGTLLYMSPEQCEAETVDERSDVWSLGTVLYEMATGERAFRGENVFIAAYEIANEDPIAIEELRRDVPAGLKQVIEKALEKDRDFRYQKMSELEADLAALQSIPPQPVTPQETAVSRAQEEPAVARRRRIPRYSLAGALIIALAAFVAFAGESIYCRLRPASAWCATEAVTPEQVGTQPVLDYWITVQRYRDGAPYRDPFRLDREMVFESDYRIYLHFEMVQGGNLYILNAGPAGNRSTASYNLLFPKVTINGGDPFLPAGHRIQIPESGGFVFDNEVGVETVWLVWSAQPVDALEAVRGRANARDLGVIEDAAEMAAIAGMLSQEPLPAATVERLRQKQRTRLRSASDLLIHRILLEHR